MSEETATIEAPEVDARTEAEVISAELSAAADPETAKLASKHADSMNGVVSAYIAAIESKGALKRHAAAGRKALEHASMVKTDMPRTWEAKDFDDVMRETARRLALILPIRDPRPDDSVRSHLFCESVKPVVPNVADLPYSLVANLLTRGTVLAFDKRALSGEVKAEWMETVRSICERQLSSTPMRVAEIELVIADHAAKLDAERKAGTDPAKLAEIERKAALAKENANRNKARSNVSRTMQNVAEVLKPAEIASLIEEAGVTLPNVGPDPVTMTEDQARQFAALLHQGRNWKAMLVLKAELSKYLDQAMAQAKATQADAA